MNDGDMRFNALSFAIQAFNTEVSMAGKEAVPDTPAIIARAQDFYEFLSQDPK